MSQLAHDEPQISTLKVSSQGQVTLSKEARKQHGLNAGETVIEISLPGCIILLPQSEVMADLMLRAQSGLQRLGLSVEELKVQVAKRTENKLAERYPGAFSD
ncbi:MAG: AbrB/MazE/SpoVT family DNA-binding domain-containing protein [Candidatus Obscuribacterales bacterium]|nr:AbrB/MazE/SpoVT family DNA-binding domain-containing protein [Candidatus Obscuribacterales bacterium]